MLARGAAVASRGEEATMSGEDAVRAASAKFYAALNGMIKGDSGGMAEVWVQDGSVTALHPIGGRTVGWQAVADSFEKVAALSSGGSVALEDQAIEVSGDMAYETGVETGTVTLAGTPTTIEHRVTNVYRRGDGGWRIVHHHTDIAPAMLDVLAKLQADR
jgi:uncharacterized protein (TIGR02246 family)